MKIKLDDLYKAYRDCRRNKTTSHYETEFESDEMVNINKLYEDLLSDNYEISESIAFIVTKPKLREVFAASFRDRIVHHYLIMKTIDIFESEFIDDTYNCRKGKGNLYGAKRIQDKIRLLSNNYTDKCWILKLDIKSFFMNISKSRLNDKITKLLKSRYVGDDIDDIIKLTSRVIMHDPSKLCRLNGDIKLWDKLDKSKSLFNIDEDLGLAIGNLTSQIYANYYMNDFDHYIQSIEGVEYGRYVDDFILISCDKKLLLKLIPRIRTYLKDNLGLELNSNKFYLQNWDKGVSFIGYYIKGNSIYSNKRTINNALNLIKYYNKLRRFDGSVVEYFMQRYNSYTGYFIHTKSKSLLIKLWNLLDDRIKKYYRIKSDYSSISIKSKYKLKNIRLHELYNNK